MCKMRTDLTNVYTSFFFNLIIGIQMYICNIIQQTIPIIYFTFFTQLFPLIAYLSILSSSNFHIHACLLVGESVSRSLLWKFLDYICGQETGHSNIHVIYGAKSVFLARPTENFPMPLELINVFRRNFIVFIMYNSI
jgi:hypothetical protein